MVKAIEHIKKEIAALEEAVTLIAQELKAAYGVYLNSLARGMQKKCRQVREDRKSALGMQEE